MTEEGSFVVGDGGGNLFMALTVGEYCLRW